MDALAAAAVEQRAADAAPAESLDRKSLVAHKFVAYVWDAAECRGSAALRTLTEPFKEDVLFVPVASLTKPLPAWLHGTPTVVDVRDPADRQAYKGTAALQMMADSYGVAIPQPVAST